MAVAKRTRWNAASIAPTQGACEAARAIKGLRFLSDEAPTLPLPACTSPATCECKFKKYEDRRSEPRRADGMGGRGQLATGPADRRHKRGRRRSDYED